MWIILLKNTKLGEYPLREQGTTDDAQMLKKRDKERTLILVPILLDMRRKRLEEALIDQVLDVTQESLGLEMATGEAKAVAVRS